jgi:sporulation protein YlmC with PRC-barrel domain
VGDSETMTGTEGVGGSEAVTDTEGVGDSETMTDTEGVGDSESMTETGAVDSADTMALAGVSGVDSKQYVRASTLLDYDFDNMNGEVSGDLEDLLIDLSTGRVLFASIEYGGVLDLGDKDIVVPLNAFAIGEEGELVLNIDEAALENYPDVGNDWPDLNDPVWDDDVNTYWTETGIDVGAGFDEPATNVAWASDLMGYNIADLGFGAGSILDILVNLGTGQAPYVIVDHGEGLDTDPYIIPFSAFDLSDWSTEFAFGPDFTPDILENAPRFDQEMYPEGSTLDTDFGDRLESTWNDLGFSNDLNRDGEVD